MKLLAYFLATMIAVVYSQNVGNQAAETHPQLNIQSCSNSGCQSQSGAITLDANWRWTHTVDGYQNCYTGNQWDTSLCPDGKTCASNCAIDGADYSGTYGITSSGDALSMRFITNGPYSTNVGSRVYFMESDSQYKMFKLLNKEFSFDVDVSQLPCGLNGALYFVEMDQDGGMSKYSGNNAGAKYGTGYCDAQCPHDIKFIAGEANVENWTPSDTDVNAGKGKYGSCCAEVDVWEANSVSSAYTIHPCQTNGAERCDGTSCGDGSGRYNGVCDKDGCDFNSYRMGDKNFYGSELDTRRPFTVVTQFITSNGRDNGDLSEVRRIYIQDGKKIGNSASQFSGFDSYDSLSEGFCADQKDFFGDRDSFNEKGGFSQMSKAMKNGMVLVLSLWDDHDVNMLWLDSSYPTDADPNQPGIARGSCSTSSGDPKDVESTSPNATVKYSNIRFGDIGTTHPEVGVLA